MQVFRKLQPPLSSALGAMEHFVEVTHDFLSIKMPILTIPPISFPLQTFVTSHVFTYQL